MDNKNHDVNNLLNASDGWEVINLDDIENTSYQRRDIETAQNECGYYGSRLDCSTDSYAVVTVSTEAIGSPFMVIKSRKRMVTFSEELMTSDHDTTLSSFTTDEDQSLRTTEHSEPISDKRTSHRSQKLQRWSSEINLQKNYRTAHDFEKTYDMQGSLGSGGGGTVYAATRLLDGAPVAVKTILIDNVMRWGELEDCVVPFELELLHKISRSRHPGVIRMLDWYDLPDQFMLVMERPSPVLDLRRSMIAFGAFSEDEARDIICQVGEAVIHCHKNGVVHRDIKLDNVLLDLGTSEAKLIDFGCGTLLKDIEHFEFAGTVLYYPPEWFLDGCYIGQRLDSWSLGILLYSMVENRYPFQDWEEIVRCELRFHREDLTYSFKHLIKWMLMKDQDLRPTIKSVLRHPWFKMRAAAVTCTLV